jgi:hypothetical protein
VNTARRNSVVSPAFGGRNANGQRKLAIRRRSNVDTENVNDRTNTVNSTDWGISGVYGTSFRERCEEWHAFEFNEPELFFAGLIRSREDATAMLRYACAQIVTHGGVESSIFEQLYILVDRWDRVGEYDDVGAMFDSAYAEMDDAIRRTCDGCKATLAAARVYLRAVDEAHKTTVRNPMYFARIAGAL